MAMEIKFNLKLTLNMIYVILTLKYLVLIIEMKLEIFKKTRKRI